MGILSENGVHGLRYRGGALQIYTAGHWRDRPRPVRVYGVRIDTTAADPFASVVYTDDAVGLVPGGSEWDKTPVFSGIRPCLLQDGRVRGYLRPQDFSQMLDGTPADIASGAQGDVMIEIPRLAYLLAREGDYQILKVTNSPNAKALDNRFCYYAHTRVQEGDCEKLYCGAYPAWYDGAALRSLSGKMPAGMQTHAGLRAWAQARGKGYDLLAFYPLTLLQCLCVLRYKSLDLQTALGRGYTDGGTQPAPTGAANALGMYCGAAGEKGQMKFAGLEDLWGNVYQSIDGVYLDAQRNLCTAFTGFNDTGEGYRNHGPAAAANVVGTCKRIHGTNETGFVMAERTAVTDGFWCDGSILFASSLALAGGMYSSKHAAGPFLLYLNRAPATTHVAAGARLMHLAPAVPEIPVRQ